VRRLAARGLTVRRLAARGLTVRRLAAPAATMRPLAVRRARGTTGSPYDGSQFIGWQYGG
ncbi:hypothetical protein Q5762_35645, partial [Streptomyces sp. P9(2023)]|uniref:hypothetical protein n=1 Tax=Streptomyces sp. P9(2023) TaxID=3064394 RepID=UPI0028F42E41